MIAQADGAMFERMLDVGFGELLLLAAIALIALGPKQLPEVARVAGRFIADMRRMAGEIAGTLIEPIVEARDGTDEIFSALKRAKPAPEKPPRDGDEDDRKRQLSFPLFDQPPPAAPQKWKSNE